jgi:predicted transcriptional regulator
MGGLAMTQRQAAIVHDLLEIIDNSDEGIPLVKMEEVLKQAVSFAVFIKAINILMHNGLIIVDNNYVAHRVKS